MKLTVNTPGPWVVNGNAVEADLDDGTEVVAHVYGDDDAPPTGSPKANALLIAAAPDLLAALEGLVAELEEIGQRENEPDSEALTEAREAIAKTRGES